MKNLILIIVSLLILSSCDKIVKKPEPFNIYKVNGKVIDQCSDSTKFYLIIVRKDGAMDKVKVEKYVYDTYTKALMKNDLFLLQPNPKDTIEIKENIPVVPTDSI